MDGVVGEGRSCRDEEKEVGRDELESRSRGAWNNGIWWRGSGWVMHWCGS